MFLTYILICVVVISLLIIYFNSSIVTHRDKVEEEPNTDKHHQLGDYKLKNSAYYTIYYLPAIEKINMLYNYTFQCETQEDPLKCMRKKELYRIPPKDRLNTKEVVKFPEILEVRTTNINKCTDYIDLFIAIPNRPSDFFIRTLYRKYYKNIKNAKLYFFVSSSQDEIVNKDIIMESEIYGDIILFKELASYRSSSIQMYLIYKWMDSNNCYNFKYFIYHQSDVFFNFKNFLKDDLFLSKTPVPVIGVLYRNNPVVRTIGSPWYLSEAVYSEKYYPDHPSGTLFMLSSDIVKKVNSVIYNVDPKIWMDDVFMGFVLKKLNVGITDLVKRAAVVYPYFGSMTIDQAVNSFIYVHIATPGQFILFNKKLGIKI